MLEKMRTERSSLVPPPVKTGTIGLLTSFTPEIFKSEYFRLIISGIISALVNTSYELRFLMARDDEPVETSQRIIRRHSLDGLLILTWRLHARRIEDIQEGSRLLPIVAINDHTPGVRASMVYTDASLGAHMALRYLLSRGYRRFGMIQAPDKDSLDAQVRERVFRQVLQEEGIELDAAHFRKCEYFFEEDGYVKTMEMIHTAPTLPRALLCFNDDIAIGAIRALREEKILVPQQVAVMGFDGIERGKYLHPPLTTVSQPLEQMGQEMVRLALGLIRGELTQPVQKRFDHQLVIRQTA